MAWLAAGVEPDAEGDRVQARDRLADFREELYRCFTARADELFELADGVLCAGGPVRALAGLSLVPEHRRGHGALYDAVNHGRVEVARLRWALAVLTLPAWPDGRIRLGVDVSNWLRPDAATSPERMFCHVYGRGKGNAQMIPGWPYSVVAALEPGRTSWTAVLDAVRLGPADDQTEVTAAQVREVVGRLIAAGHWRSGDPGILVVFDAGYDVIRLAYLLKDLPVELLGRLRGDRVLHFPAPPGRRDGRPGRRPRHGAEFRLDDDTSWPEPAVTTVTQTTRYGTAVAGSWDRLHPRLARRSAWQHHDGPLPVIEGTLIRLAVDHLPGDRDPKPVWLWSSRTGATPAGVDRCWQAFLRRFDLEHTFRLFKQALGWTAPKVRDPAAADRWTWLIIACHAQLRPARPPQTCACPGRNQPRRDGSPPPGCAGDSATSAPPCPAPPVRPNPANPAPDGHQAPRTAARPPSAASARPAPRHNNSHCQPGHGQRRTGQPRLNAKLSRRACRAPGRAPGSG